MEGGRVVDLGLYREHVAAAAGLRAEAGKAVADGDGAFAEQLLVQAAMYEARAGAIARGQRQPVGRQPAGARFDRITG
jgi:hypothetical protein